MSTSEQKTCTKNRVLIDANVVIEPGYRGVFRGEQSRVKDLESWARGIREFFHDHRHMDVNDVRVNLEYQDQCSACGKEWEEALFEAEGEQSAYYGCAWCAAPMEIVR